MHTIWNMPKKCSLCFRAAIISRFFFKPQNPRLTNKSGLGWRVYGRYVVSITKCKVSVLGVDSLFFHHKNQTPGTNMQKPPRDTTPHTISRVIYGVYNSSTLHNDHDKENIIHKKTLEIEIWKIYRLQSSNGEKQANKRPIPKQKPCIDRQKSSFFLVVWPRNGSLSPPKMLGTPK